MRILQQNSSSATFDNKSIVPHPHPAAQSDCAKIHNIPIDQTKLNRMLVSALRILQAHDTAKDEVTA